MGTKIHNNIRIGLISKVFLAAIVFVLTICAVSCSFQKNADVSGDGSTDAISVSALDEQPNCEPSITINIDELLNKMEEIEESEAFPADSYTITVTGLSVSVKLYMSIDCVTAVETYGKYVELTKPLDIYGNCDFELFETEDAVILEGGYYDIGDIYILTFETYRVLHPGKESSYWLWLDDSGALKYRCTNNDIANIVQTGALSSAVSYDEFLYALGDASIQNGEAFFSEPTEYYTMADRYDLDAEFKHMWSDSYKSIEEKFAANRSAREQRQQNIDMNR